MTALSKDVLSLLKRLKRAAEDRSEISVRSGETQNCFPMRTLYSCTACEAKGVSAAQHGAGRHLPCVRLQCKYEDMVVGEKSSNRLGNRDVADSEKCRNLPEKAGNMAGGRRV